MLYTFTGAIPKYIELLVDAGPQTKDKMIDCIARPDSPFVDEDRKLLVNEFGKKSGGNKPINSYEKLPQ